MLPLLLGLLNFVALPPGPVDAYGDPLPPGAVARLGSARWRCPDPPDHLIWAPDGKHLVGTHGGRSLTIWAHPSGVVAGRFLIPGFWDPEAELPVSFKSPPTLTADQVRFAPDSRSMLVYAGRNQLYRVSVPNGRATRLPTGNLDGAALAVSADGRRLILETNVVHGEDGRWSDLAVLDRDRPDRLLTLMARRRTHALYQGLRGLHNTPVVAKDLTLSPDGRFVLADLNTDEWSALTAIDVMTGQRWHFDGGRVGPPAFLPDGRTFLTRHGGGRLARWQLVTNGPGHLSKLVLAAQTDLPEELPIVRQVISSPNGRQCVLLHDSERLSGKVREQPFTLLDAVTLRPLRTWGVPADVGAVDWRTQIWRVYRGRADFGDTAVAVAPDGRTVAVASLDAPLIRFFNVETGTEIRHQGGHAERIDYLAFSPTSRELISVSAEKAGRAWDLEPLVNRGVTPRMGIRESGVRARVRDTDLLPRPISKRKLVYDAERDRMQLRDSETEEVVRELPNSVAAASNHLRDLLPTAASAEGWWVAYRRGDQVVVHDQESGLRIAEYRIPGSWPTDLEFVPGTDLVVAGYHDGQILIWRVRPAGVPDRRPTVADLDRAWADLGTDPATAVRGRAVLLADPAASVAWLKERLRPIPHPTEYDIDLWLARLAHGRYPVREEAARQLARHFDVSERPMREVLAVTRSLEVETRLRAVLESRTRGGDAEAARLVRLVVVLERMRTPAARELLFRIARGAGVPAVRATDALERWPSDEGQVRRATRAGRSR